MSERDELMLFLGLDLAVMGACYITYKLDNSIVSDIEKAPTVVLNAELGEKIRTAEGGCLPYACIHGKVSAIDEIIRSLHDQSKQGIVWRYKEAERILVQVDNKWKETDILTKNETKIVPFVLNRSWGSTEVSEIEIPEPESAAYLMNGLTVTYEEYRLPKIGFTSKIVNILEGVDLKDYKKKETMLLSGTEVLAIGQINFVNGKLVLTPPSNGCPYIITALSKQALLTGIACNSLPAKIVFVGSGLLAVALVIQIARCSY